MSMYSSVKRTQKADQPLGGIDELILRMRQLIRHRGYDRDKIVSAILRRYLPNAGGSAWNGEAVLRQNLTQAKLDQRSIDHLVANVMGELHMAHERLAG